jgi:uncharacterized integral membrane protein
MIIGLFSESAWESPLGLGFMLFALSAFLLAFGKFLTYLAITIRTLRK